MAQTCVKAMSSVWFTGGFGSVSKRGRCLPAGLKDSVCGEVQRAAAWFRWRYQSVEKRKIRWPAPFMWNRCSIKNYIQTRWGSLTYQTWQGWMKFLLGIYFIHRTDRTPLMWNRLVWFITRLKPVIFVFSSIFKIVVLLNMTNRNMNVFEFTRCLHPAPRIYISHH